jgi:BirA family biotin operon repressor/biotin-[acetyl-CoA-carboxylase] ligase
MDLSRILSTNGEPNGTVIVADFQEKGRGRQNRQWKTEKGQNLMFTLFLNYADCMRRVHTQELATRGSLWGETKGMNPETNTLPKQPYPDRSEAGLVDFSSIPKALTLRTGLAVALAIEDFIPCLSGFVAIKWPNDIMLKSKKTAGILVETTIVENDNTNVFIGIGVNLLQREFPEELRGKAGSLLTVFTEVFPDREIPSIFAMNDAPLLLLERILAFLHSEITAQKSAWKTRLEKKLYKRGEAIVFAEGAADSQKLIQGQLFGIADTGELLIIPEGETAPLPFVNGELRVY